MKFAKLYSRIKSLQRLRESNFFDAEQITCLQVVLTIAFIVLVFSLLPFAAAAFDYTVEPGDTLYGLAREHDTSVDELAVENGITNPNLIYVGQVLSIEQQATETPSPTATLIPTTAVSPTVTLMPTVVTVSQVITPTPTVTPTVTLSETVTPIPSATPTVSSTGEVTATQTIDPTPTLETPFVQEDLTCTRFNFDLGRDAIDGSIAGLFVMVDPNDGPITSWFPLEGTTDSGWINDLPIRFNAVYVQVEFYDLFADEEDPPVIMEIINPAANTDQGWLARGVCHAIEIQYPEGYRESLTRTAETPLDDRFILVKP